MNPLLLEIVFFGVLPGGAIGFFIGRLLAERQQAEKMLEVTESGEFDFNRFSGGYSPVPPDGKVHMNITRITCVDGTNPEDLNRAYL